VENARGPLEPGLDSRRPGHTRFSRESGRSEYNSDSDRRDRYDRQTRLNPNREGAPFPRQRYGPGEPPLLLPALRAVPSRTAPRRPSTSTSSPPASSSSTSSRPGCRRQRRPCTTSASRRSSRARSIPAGLSPAEGGCEPRRHSTLGSRRGYEQPHPRIPRPCSRRSRCL
jgi:hypothetical protein